MSDTEIGAGTTYVSGIALNSGDVLWVDAGAEVDGQLVELGGGLYNYGSISDSLIFAGGVLVNNSIATGITLAGGYAQNYGIITGISVASGGELDVVSGEFGLTGTVFAAEILSGGVEMNDGYEAGGTILAGGLEIVGSGGVAVGDSVQAGGYLVVLPGGTATANGQVISTGELLLGPGSVVTLDPAGPVIVSSGLSDDVLSDAVVTAAQILSGGSETLYAGQTDNVTIGNGGLQLLSGGIAFDSLVQSGGQQSLFGGTASRTTIANGGYGVVYTSGTAVNWLVQSGGSAMILEGLGTGITVQAGGTLVSDYGFTSRTLIEYGGVEYTQGGTATGSEIMGGGMQVLQYGTAYGATVAQGGVQLVEAGALASGTTLLAGGVQVVLPGATVTGDSGSGDVVSSGAVAVLGAQAPVLNPQAPMLLSGISAQEFVLTGGSVSGATLAQGATQFVYGGTVSGTVLDAGGTQFLSGGTAYDTLIEAGGSEIIGDFGTGGLAVDSTIDGGTLLLNTDGTLGGALFFAGASGTFITDQTRFGTGLGLPVISGFAAGDVLDFSELNYVSGTSSLTVAGEVVTINGPPGEQVLLTLSGDAGANFMLQADAAGGTELIIEAPLCFLAGTRLATPGGEVAVEDIRIGDLVLTEHAGAVPVRWVGWRAYGGGLLAANPQCQPVRIAAGALADGVPARDLYVSAGHGLFIDGALFPAGLLVNGVNITRAALNVVEYYHLDLGAQEFLYAQGCAAESFAGEDLRGRFQNAADYHALYPDAAPVNNIWLEHLQQGFGLEAIRSRINARAGLIQAVRPAGALRGYVDAAGPERVAGWAQWENAPELPVQLEVWRGNVRLARLLANYQREDLREAGLGSGRHGFWLTLPPGEGRVHVHAVEGGVEIQLTETALASRAA